MRIAKNSLALGCAAMVAACGGGGGSGSGGQSGGGTATPTPTPTSTTATCSLSARQDFVREALEQYYLFPSLLATNVNKSSYTDLQAYIDALVAPARAQGRDRFFTYITSIEEENAFIREGSSAGFGFRLGYDGDARRVFVIETFEGTAALGANIDRGSEILAIGTSTSNLQTVSSIYANGGAFAVSEALGPGDAGVTRVLRVRDQSGVEREVTLTKTEYELDPVSDRYGAKVLDDGGKKVGYLNLRTFIDSAEDDLISAFADFRAQGITEYVIDLRYNGGGLLSTAEVFGDLLARDLNGLEYYTIAFNDANSSENDTYNFMARPQSVAPTKIAFITTGSTASASELLINGQLPYRDQISLVGEDTFGKPVGQIAIDRAACDDRFRVLAFALENANGQGAYFDGLSEFVDNTCRAEDDISYQMGDPREEMTARALDTLAGRTCTPFAGSGITTQSVRTRGVIEPRNADTIDRYLPGRN